MESSEQGLTLLAKACRFQGRQRERMLALGFADELFVRLHPHSEERGYQAFDLSLMAFKAGDHAAALDLTDAALRNLPSNQVASLLLAWLTATPQASTEPTGTVSDGVGAAGRLPSIDIGGRRRGDRVVSGLLPVQDRR